MYAWDKFENQKDGNFVGWRWNGNIYEECLILRKNEQWFQLTKWSEQRHKGKTIFFYKNPMSDKYTCDLFGIDYDFYIKDSILNEAIVARME